MKSEKMKDQREKIRCPYCKKLCYNPDDFKWFSDESRWFPDDLKRFFEVEFTAEELDYFGAESPADAECIHCKIVYWIKADIKRAFTVVETEKGMKE